MIVRRVLGSLAGVAATVATIMAVEAIGHRVTGTPSDPAQATVPMMLWVLAAWAIGPLIGGFVGVSVARWGGAAWIAAALVIVGVVATMLTIPTPWWMATGGIVLPLVAARLVTRRADSGDQRVAL
ncbi:hypothetical protein [Sphingomonas sp. LHG3406-1]|uniref:hypothetical protein n=1 Tax=Sphingomonas sp. LHG3406-1 TaxID=2804617 RepID=UPI002637EE6B|nr:hypothetical protein [Sphingomonas sp. LHG3406-1]